VALYNGMYMLPLLAAGMAAGRMMRPAAAERLPQKISKIRVIFGGAFFGLGFGLLYMVL